MPAKSKINAIQFERAIGQIAADRINKILPQLVDEIEREIDDAIEIGMRQSPTVQSLTSSFEGDLKQELGLTQAETKVEFLIDEAKKLVTVEAKPVRGGIRAKKPIIRIKSNLDNIRNLFFASSYFIQQNYGAGRNRATLGNPEYIPWLQWLLEGGRRPLVNRDIIRNSNTTGRSGGSSYMSKKPGSWSIPPEHAGTISNNFLTRVFDKISTQVTKIIKTKTISRIKRGV